MTAPSFFVKKRSRLPVSRLMIKTKTTIRIIKRKITTEAAAAAAAATTTRAILHFQIHPSI